MQFRFSEDQLLFRDTVAELFANECPPAAVRAARGAGTGRIPGLWDKLADMGVIGLLAPEAAGGLGMDEITLVLLQEEAGRVACPEPLVELASGLPALIEAGRHDDVAAVAAGTSTVTIGLAGQQFVAATATADLYVLEADSTLHLLTAEQVEVGPVETLDESRRLAAITWDPTSGVDLGAADPSLAFDRAALATAAQAVGVGQYLLDATVAYVADRHQFGKPVGSYQAVKHHLANVALRLEFARPYVYRAAWCVARNSPERARDVSAAKALSADAADLAARLALQCHGAIGYTDEYDLQLWLKRAWTLAAAHGDAAWHRNRVGLALGI